MNKWTRRSFITAGVVGTGALIVGVAVRPGNRISALNGLVVNDQETLVNAWVKINPDNTVTVIVPHCEMGQGVHTSLPMMLAEEMDIDWHTVNVMEAPDDLEYANYALGRGFIIGDVSVPKALVQTVNGSFLKITQMLKLQITGGSTSLRTTGVHAMRMAGASAREMLIETAANDWKVATNEIRTEANYLYHDASKRSASYADFAKLAAEITPPSAPKLKSPSEYKIVGTSPTRLDLPAKVNGSAGFGIDTALPDMLYATVRGAPVHGGMLGSVDASKAEKMKGVVKVVQLDNAVAVIAKGYWQALQALNALSINWRETESDNITSKTIFAQFDTDMKKAISDGNEKTDVEKGDVEKAMAQATTYIEAEYSQPYLTQAPMEPLNCTVHVKADSCEVWTGCQNPLGFRSEIAEVLGFDLENVMVHNAYLGGGFGRRALADFATQAALIGVQVESPVKVIWSREEDIRQGRYRQACLSKFKAGLDENGQPVAWVNQYVDKHEPEEAPHIPYAIDNQFIHYTDSPTHIPFGPWRSVDHSLHAFFTESFIDEIAAKVGKDGYQYRRGLLQGSPRYLALLDKVASLSNWDEEVPQGRGKGIAIHQSFNSIVAQVAEVVVKNGTIKVKKVTCVVDAGFAINPDGLIAQMEGGIIYGLTAALYGEISVEKGQIKQSNFHDYQMLRMHETPEIQVSIINSGESLGGGGEPGTPPIVPAVANAIYAATGKRIRSLPLSLALKGKV